MTIHLSSVACRLIVMVLCDEQKRRATNFQMATTFRSCITIHGEHGDLKLVDCTGPKRIVSFGSWSRRSRCLRRIRSRNAVRIWSRLGFPLNRACHASDCH